MPVTAFDGRLDLLTASGQVTPQARDLVAQFIDEVEREFPVALDEDNGALIVTHLALAMTRLTNGTGETEAPAALADEVAAHPRELAFVRGILDNFAKAIGREVPEVEVLYMTAHLCVLTQSDPA